MSGRMRDSAYASENQGNIREKFYLCSLINRFPNMLENYAHAEIVDFPFSMMAVEQNLLK